MRLYFNGCSHTWGDDLDDPPGQAWPTIVAKTYGCDFLNDSVPGGTNDRIMYRTIKHADEFDKFYIAWTYTSRFTRYRPDNNFEVNFNPNMKNSTYGSDSSFKKYAHLHYKYWYNELYSFKIWLQNIILLQRFFDSIGKPYVMINANHNHIHKWDVGWQDFNDNVKSLLCFDLMSDEQLLLEQQEIKSLINKISFDRYYGWNENWYITKLHDTFPVGKTNHLLANGHKAVAEYIFTHDQS